MTVTLGNVVYNPARSAFEARVDIAREGRTFRYPCEVPGPVTMEMKEVHAALRQRAMNMSDSPTMMSVR